LAPFVASALLPKLQLHSRSVRPKAGDNRRRLDCGRRVLTQTCRIALGKAGHDIAATVLSVRHLRGRLISPADTDYDTARKVCNGRMGRRPSWVALCADEKEVVALRNVSACVGS